MGCVGGGAYGNPLSTATAAASPVPSVPSGGGGVFSRCFMGSGAAGATGLYGSGAYCCSCVGGGEAGVCSFVGTGAAVVGAAGGGGNEFIPATAPPCVVGKVFDTISDREFRVCPF